MGWVWGLVFSPPLVVPSRPGLIPRCTPEMGLRHALKEQVMIVELLKHVNGSWSGWISVHLYIPLEFYVIDVNGTNWLAIRLVLAV